MRRRANRLRQVSPEGVREVRLDVELDANLSGTQVSRFVTAMEERGLPKSVVKVVRYMRAGDREEARQTISISLALNSRMTATQGGCS